jgi:hypothetical protein
MPRPPKVFPQPIHSPASNQYATAGGANWLGRSAQLEPTIPEWVVEVLLSVLFKRRKRKRAALAARELVYWIKFTLAMERKLRNTPMGAHFSSKEEFLADSIERFLKSGPWRGTHDPATIQAQAMSLSVRLQSYAACKSYEHRSRWIAKNSAQVLEQIAHVAKCGPRCPMLTRPPTDEHRKVWATQSQGLAGLRTEFLAYHHGLHPDTIRRLW